MSDDETRRADAMQEAAIERALRKGEMGYCWFCDSLTTKRAPEDDEYFDRWICKACQSKLKEENHEPPA